MGTSGGGRGWEVREIFLEGVGVVKVEQNQLSDDEKE